MADYKIILRNHILSGGNSEENTLTFLCIKLIKQWIIQKLNTMELHDILYKMWLLLERLLITFETKTRNFEGFMSDNYFHLCYRLKKERLHFCRLKLVDSYSILSTNPCKLSFNYNSAIFRQKKISLMHFHFILLIYSGFNCKSSSVCFYEYFIKD